ncbi:nicotinamide riboside transporter PnuC [uncultured Clostridium sp.]|uniref:nicotinamide riboside transporter PnuC n=1 Tax=uncultured Clostridium sp. TaxID=59620 RepID=UPI002631DA18|nr:nicotinamide riboside transporter PnuC [uncultured Clostridium sp.]
MTFFKKYSSFHKTFFLVFALINISLFIAPLFFTGSLSSIFNFASIIGLISTFAGLFAAIYTARGEVLCYLWGFLNALVYIYIVFTGDMYGQAILFTFFKLPMQVIGYKAWKKSLANSDDDVVEVKKLTNRNWVTLVTSFFVIWIAYGIFLKFLPQIFDLLFNKTITPDSDFIVDALASTLTILAVILSTKRFMEQWYLWLSANSIGILLFTISIIQNKSFTLTTFAGMIIWTQFTVNAVYGYINWRKLNRKATENEYKNNKKEECIATI